jgi:hypothetical protein
MPDTQASTATVTIRSSAISGFWGRDWSPARRTNDPSGIATCAVAGAALGFGMLWTAPAVMSLAALAFFATAW